MVNYEITDRAIEDLRAIWLYTFEHWSLEQADKYDRLIRSKMSYVAEHPMHGRRYLKRDGYRIIKVKSHSIYYKILEDDTVKIMRVLHERMDAESRLSE